MTASDLKRPRDNWELLGLARFLLAFIVFFTHLGLSARPIPWYLRIYQFGAFTAVLCFLVLSGYSIGHSIARNPKGYYRRRILRIYPLYFLAIALTIVVALWQHMDVAPRLIKVGIGNMLFMQTYKFTPMLCNPVVGHWPSKQPAICLRRCSFA